MYTCNMLSFLTIWLPTIAVVHGAAINLRSPDGGAQVVPSTPPTKFNNGAAMLGGEPPQDTTVPVPDVYGAREVDIPFYRLFHGNLKFFSTGQLNTPDKDTDMSLDAGGVDNANQSACGIPDNAFSLSKVAIHPYFLKYADLSRFCEQDVCISFWKEDGSSDMELKVTDICSTDENDPTHCSTPMDIKIDRSKAKIMEGLSSTPTGNDYPEQVWWFFDKCWDDGLVQPPYQNNWFAEPNLPNNLNWSQSTSMEQYQNNQKAYPAKGWPTYPNGGYNTTRVAEPLSDWTKGEEPCYQPIAGGKGWGTNICGNGQSSSSPSNSTSLSSTPSVASSAVSQAAQSSSVALSDLVSSSTSSFTSVLPASSSSSHIEPQVQDEDEQDECEL